MYSHNRSSALSSKAWFCCIWLNISKANYIYHHYQVRLVSRSSQTPFFNIHINHPSLLASLLDSILCSHKAGVKSCYIIKEWFFYFNHFSFIFYHSVWLAFELFGLRVQLCNQLVQFTFECKGYDNHYCNNKPQTGNVAGVCMTSCPQEMGWEFERFWKRFSWDPTMVLRSWGPTMVLRS